MAGRTPSGGADQLLKARGIKSTKEIIESFWLEPLFAQMARQVHDLDASFYMVFENGVWLVCDAFAEDASPAPNRDPVASSTV